MYNERGKKFEMLLVFGNIITHEYLLFYLNKFETMMNKLSPEIVIPIIMQLKI